MGGVIETGLKIVNWIQVAQERLKWHAFCESGNEPSGSIKVGRILTNWDIMNFSRKALYHKVSYLVMKI
jgi:hypothetical protein